MMKIKTSILKPPSLNREGGFTLVELAIVMIIIGLLIGGILKGQELVANAQLTATVAQIKGIDGALSTFRDKYSAMPGDMANAGTRLRDCAGNCATGAATGRTGDGRINVPNTLGSLPVATSEGVVAFTHIAAADLISGVDISAPTLSFGSALPEAKIGGGFWLGFTSNGAARGGVTSTQAAQIDRKVDDGDPLTGDVQAIGNNCRDANLEYQESSTTANCSIYIRAQG